MTELERQYRIVSDLQGFLCDCNEYSGVCVCMCVYICYSFMAFLPLFSKQYLWETLM